jgi:hypothetical protein
MLYGVLGRGHLAAGGDVTDEVQGVGLDLADASLAARRQGFFRASGGILVAPGRQVGIAKGDQRGRIQAARRLSDRDCPLQARYGLFDTADERVRRPSEVEAA